MGSRRGIALALLAAMTSCRFVGGESTASHVAGQFLCGGEPIKDHLLFDPIVAVRFMHRCYTGMTKDEAADRCRRIGVFDYNFIGCYTKLEFSKKIKFHFIDFSKQANALYCHIKIKIEKYVKLPISGSFLDKMLQKLVLVAAAAAIALINPTFGSYVVVRIKGRFICKGEPLQNATVSLVEKNVYLVNVDLAFGATNQNGEFEMAAFASEWIINPSVTLRLEHHCYRDMTEAEAATKCNRLTDYDIPWYFMQFDTHVAKRVYSIGEQTVDSTYIFWNCYKMLYK
ncbi:unnamed protein product [Caenorhabditis bovis]|uniref:Uncharacterized protein n=1 Tax=Caenorhabditis bovis TaxID=2654633 RepID=A0A8S1EFE4_9PELO|nr:unnamed protein product [Caenorhabditis bovis]